MLIVHRPEGGSMQTTELSGWRPQSFSLKIQLLFPQLEDFQSICINLLFVVGSACRHLWWPWWLMVGEFSVQAIEIDSNFQVDVHIHMVFHNAILVQWYVVFVILVARSQWACDRCGRDIAYRCNGSTYPYRATIRGFTWHTFWPETSWLPTEETPSFNRFRDETQCRWREERVHWHWWWGQRAAAFKSMCVIVMSVMSIGPLLASRQAN